MIKEEEEPILVQNNDILVHEINHMTNDFILFFTKEMDIYYLLQLADTLFEQ